MWERETAVSSDLSFERRLMFALPAAAQARFAAPMHNSLLRLLCDDGERHQRCKSDAMHAVCLSRRHSGGAERTEAREGGLPPPEPSPPVAQTPRGAIRPRETRPHESGGRASAAMEVFRFAQLGY